MVVVLLLLLLNTCENPKVPAARLTGRLRVGTIWLPPDKLVYTTS